MNFLPFAQVAPAPNAPNPLMMQMILMAMIFAIFYFILIKPQKKKQAEHEKMVGGLKKNDEVVTIGGILGTVVNVKDNTVVLRVDDNVKIEFQKSAIAVIKKQS